MASELSKTQLKRALKRERITDKYKRQKEEKKSKKLSLGTSEAQDIPVVENNGIRPIRQERNAMFRADFESRCAQGPTVVIDCEWGDKMTDRELLSLTQQIMYSYSSIKNSEKPVRLWVVGASDKQTKLFRNLPGADSWYMVFTSKSIKDIFMPSEDVVYLSADSEDVLSSEDITSRSILIIGGIVDRNRHRDATLNKANVLGFRTAQLPIGEYMPLKSSKVLTVNHVVQILVDVNTTSDWRGALNRVIPDRKRDLDDSKSS
jgi:tRNA (guanine9-N1)-methyltransferase